MELEKVIRILVAEFEKNNVRYALIGGYALGLLGIPRGTIDLDFLIARDDINTVDSIMHDLEYEKVFGSEDVSQYVSELKLFGEVDVIHAFRKPSLDMLQNALPKNVFDGHLQIRVLRPEDMIGLKLQAIINNQERTDRDMADIKDIMREYGTNLDWGRIASYFAMFDRTEDFVELENKYANR